MLDRVQTVGASLRVQQEQPLGSEIILVQQLFFCQRMTGGQNAGNRDLDQLFINASLIFLSLFLKCYDHIRSPFF